MRFFTRSKKNSKNVIFLIAFCKRFGYNTNMKTDKLFEFAHHLSQLWDMPCEVLLLGDDAKDRCQMQVYCERPCDRQQACRYGCSEAYRWGGRYIYYCREGATFIAASVSNERGELIGGLILGPMIIGDVEDLIQEGMPTEQKSFLRSLKWISTEKVNAMAEIMAAVTQSISEAPHTVTGTIQFDYSVVKHADTVYKIMEYIKKNCHRKIQLEELAKLTHFNKAYLSRIFKKETGETLSSFITRMRVEEAQKLLLETDLSLAQISSQVGFEDQSYFTKAFKAVAAITPGQLRAAHKKK